MKAYFPVFAFAMALTLSIPAAGQCNCQGPICQCSCNRLCCVCICTNSGCECRCMPDTIASLTAGTKVSEASNTLSVATGEKIVVLAGGDAILPADIKTTPWQAVVRLNMLPGVKLGEMLVPETAELPPAGEPATVKSFASGVRKVSQIKRLSPTEEVSICVSQAAGLNAALDRLSHASGYAFDVSGSPAPSFTVKAKGTLDEILAQLSSAAGVSITVAH
jgi:hypothetical protein